MLIAASFTVAKTWKQPKCSSTDQLINKWYISHKKRNFTICNNMDELEGIMLSEISQTEKDKYCMLSLTCGI